MSAKTRVVNCIHTKLVGTANNQMRIGRDQIHGTSFAYNSLYVRNIAVFGNGSALPAVLFVRIGLELAQCYTVSIFNTTEAEKEQDTRIPFYTANAADSRRLISQCSTGELHTIENKVVSIESINVTTGKFAPFTDYTCFVVELEMES